MADETPALSGTPRKAGLPEELQQQPPLQAACADLAGWSTSGSGVPARLVTGAAGSGASWLAHWVAAPAPAPAPAPDERAHVFPDASDGVQRPPDGAFDVAVEATGLGLAEVDWRITEQADALTASGASPATTPPATTTPPRRASALLALKRAAKRLGRPLVVAVLGAAASGGTRLPGASRPVVDELLVPLLKMATGWRSDGGPPGAPAVRVLADLPRDEAERAIRAAGLGAECVLDLNAPEYASPRDEFRSWVHDVLTAPGGHYASEAPQAREALALATDIAVRTWPDFRFAGTLARILRTRPEPWRRDSGRSLPERPEEAWDFFLDGAGENGDRLSTLLAPLTAAEGTYGLPENLWTEAATRLLGRSMTAQQMHAVAAALAPFIERTRGESDGRHPHGTPPSWWWRLRDPGLERLLPPYDRPSLHRTLAEVMEEALPLSDVAAVAGPAVVTPREAYARRFGVSHAVRGGALDRWLSSPARALVTDRDTVAEALRWAEPADGEQVRRRRAAIQEELRAYRTLPARDAAERAARLQWCAALCRDEELAAWADTCGLVLPWRTLWSSMRPLGTVDTDLIDPQWPGPLELVAVRTGTEGPEICVQDVAEGSFQWWSADLGRPAGERFRDEPEEAGKWPDPDETGHPDEAGMWIDEDEDSSDTFDPVMLRASDPHSGDTTQWMMSATQGYADVAALGDGRFCVVGHGGLAVVAAGRSGRRHGPRLSASRAPTAASPWSFRRAWTAAGPLAGTDLESLARRQGGFATTPPSPPAGLAVLSRHPETVRLLREIGLPRRSHWFRDIEESLRTLPTYRTWLDGRDGRDAVAVDGAPDDGDTQLVIGRSPYGGPEAALCLDTRTGDVAVLTTVRRTPVNSSLEHLLRFLAITDWAAAFGSSRDPDEYDEFRAWLRRLLSTLDPEAFTTRQGTTFWQQVFHDDMAFLLE
ncbi:hypothetical protein [Streptomyces sp. NPDC057694]|uniref:hypothetical protein n=1 Tax=Streptomyces sp. NPDC057694 TaxID=3346216 RepID=UPI00368F536C